jgi:hypothetical protein
MKVLFQGEAAIFRLFVRNNYFGREKMQQIERHRAASKAQKTYKPVRKSNSENKGSSTVREDERTNTEFRQMCTAFKSRY